MVRKTAAYLLVIIIITTFSPIYGSDSISVNKKRLTILLAGSGLIYSVSLVGLNQLWYAGYPRTKFHFFNDNSEWLQFDKAGHFATAYYESLFGINAMKWAGVKDKKTYIYGGLYGIIFQTPIEILDGFSSQWGASTGDLIANTLGATLIFSQYLFWDEPVILLKFSFHRTKYAPLRPDVLGKNLAEEILKDYNGGTIWLSTSINHLYPGKKIFPDWLSLSIGYGAEEMLAGRLEDVPIDLSHYHFRPYRQFYLAFDINTLKIKTETKFLRYLLAALSVIKVPSPAVEFSKYGIKFHPVYF